MTEIDERYKRGMIYTIRNIKDDTMIYVGSSINNLSKRFNHHKRDCKCGKSAISLYKHIKNNDWTDWYIELYELYPCNSKKELERREGQVIREIGTINKKIAGRTKEEWCEDNPEYNKKYYEGNADKYKEKGKKRYEENTDIIKEKVMQYYKENVEKILKYKKSFSIKHADKLKKYHEEYRQKNTDKIKKNREDNRQIIAEKRAEKICCDICGSSISRSSKYGHQKSKKCISKSLNNTDIPSDTHI